MYALSQGRRHKPEDDADDDVDRPRVPQRSAPHQGSAELQMSESRRKPLTASFAQHHDRDDDVKRQAARPCVSSKSGTESTPIAAHEKRQILEDSYEDDETAGKAKADANAVGAVAIHGSWSSRHETRPESATGNERHAYQDSFVNRSPSGAGEGTPAMSTQDEAVVARCVSDDEADIEAQVQSRMNAEAKDIADMIHRQLIANSAVAEAQPSVQSTASLTAIQGQDDQTLQQQKQKRLCIIVIAVLAIIAAIGAGVGVAVSNKSDSPTAPSSSPADQCTFCYDGSTPPHLDTNDVLGQTCEDYRRDQVLLDSADPNCVLGQALAAYSCNCPTFPPRPKNPTCTLCENRATPSGPGCFEQDTLIQHLGGSPSYSCGDLIASALENGCNCPGHSVNPIEPFQTLLTPISGDSLNDQDSPQFRALYWIANDDPANLSVGATTDSVIENRYVAAVLYYAFAGESWTEQYNFLSQGDICTWKQSDFEGMDHGIVCDSGGNVETLRLPENKLFGSIPQELAFLSGLTTIEMAVNTISGSLPSSISKLSRLESIDFSENQLTGLLPEHLFTNQQLKRILFDDNRFSGTISPLLGTSQQLEFFLVANSTLTGTLPSSLGKSSRLRRVDLNGNHLDGTIPDFSPSSRLFLLRLSRNDILGTLPSTIGVASQLEYLLVAGNRGVNGQIPSEVGQLSNLIALLLYNNSFTGTLPSELGSLNNLEYLNFRDNALAGPLPTELGSLSSLKELQFKNNRFSNTIPTELENCISLVYISVDNNLLTGAVDTVIDSLPRSIESFDIGANFFEGPIPTSIGSLTNLDFFDARANKLNGTIANEFGQLSNLKVLDLASNKFTGTVPTSIASLPRLVRFRIYDNDLSGSLDEFCANQNYYSSFAANVCGEEEIECPCCTHCCRPASFECTPV